MTTNPSYLFIVGAAKAGTTSMAAWLDQTADACLAATKESRYFTDFADIAWDGPGGAGFRSGIVRDFAAYDALFAAKPNAAWRIDASTDYLWCAKSSQMIADFAKSHRVKVIAILRDPVARIISEFQHTLRDELQSGTLLTSIDAEEKRRSENWLPLFYHLERSRYAAQVARYKALFGDDFLVIDFHSFGQNGDGMVQAAEFIGVKPPETTQTVVKNKSFVPRSGAVASLAKSQVLKAALRRVVPQKMRGAIRQTVLNLNRTDYKPSQAELTRLRDLLAADIAACVADPLIPTDNWHLARNLPQQADR